ncbi:MAG TPA: HlyD family efflux transporter periplasmic adaptor subunit [Terriglobales bacterium]|nr:HlyD family efflux transporter periplasmic adaptor subunit [Terriglobales bacterium]
MDIPRPQARQARRRKRLIYAGISIAVLLGVTLGLSRLKPAAPPVERSTVWVDTVKRGPMLRQVRGIGTLVPEEIRWIAALSPGRVERILVKPGAAVKAETVLVELSNPQVRQAAVDAEYQVKAAEAEYNSLHVQLQSAVLNQKALAARAQRDYSEADMRAKTDTELAKLGVISQQTETVSSATAKQLAMQREIEQERLANSSRELEARLAAQRARIDQLKALYRLQLTQMEALKVRAGSNGVLQELSIDAKPVQVGQEVAAGTTLAKVAQPQHLIAQLRIPETQVKDVQLSQPAQVDTHNGVIPGHVTRVDPAVQNGTVLVDVALDGPLPQGARPDLNVDGTIDLERLANVLYVGRPAFGQEKSTVSMFKLQPDGTAVRIQVQVGRSSVSSIEIVGGLKEGDEVILSDMSRWDKFDRVRLD